MNIVPTVAVVILNWNGKHHLEKFLRSVLKSSYKNLEIIVGDNASSDGSVAWLGSSYPQVSIIENDENYGFAGGYNKVLAQVDADYFVLLNSDVEVTENWIEPIIDLMEKDSSIAACQPKILALNDRQSFEYAGAAGGWIDNYGYPFCRGRIFDTVEKDTGQYDSNTLVFWASGAALFIRKSCWQEVGGLDADFFAHMEEIDLCWRLQNLGYKIMCCPKSVVYHLGGGTLNADSPYKTYLNFRNSLVMLQKNLPASRVYFILFIRFWLDLIALLKFMADGKPDNAKAVSKAHVNFVRNFSANQKKRLKINPKALYGLYGGSIVWDYFVRGKKRFGGGVGKMLK